ncbi:hypothetical protein C8J57DRAFT_1568971 [Mycena rebaudengoi]|nr:hypothetical protein C8J57DRAFT_1568971 [Mycena rebaudengoi]
MCVVRPPAARLFLLLLDHLKDTWTAVMFADARVLLQHRGEFGILRTKCHDQLALFQFASEPSRLPLRALWARRLMGKQKAEDTMGDITITVSPRITNHGQESAAFFLPPPPRSRAAPIASFGQPDASLGGSALDSPVSAFASMHAAPVCRAPVPTQSNSHGSGGSGVRRAVTMGAVPGSRDRSRTDSRIPAVGSHSRIPTGSHSRSSGSIPSSSARAPPSSARIPSSSSSYPPRPSPALRRELSPPQILDERTQALQESITSLLGKRWSAVLDDEQELQHPRARGRSSPRCVGIFLPSLFPSSPFLYCGIIADTDSTPHSPNPIDPQSHSPTPPPFGRSAAGTHPGNKLLSESARGVEARLTSNSMKFLAVLNDVVAQRGERIRGHPVQHIVGVWDGTDGATAHRRVWFKPVAFSSEE